MKLAFLYLALSVATGAPASADGAARPASAIGGPGDPPASGDVYDGRSGQTRVKPPRLEETGSAVDGLLSEEQWKSASLLTGFSQFAPVDGIAAEDSTEVLVWYSATAIHFGIRAFEPHGAVRATLANRDNISSDDNIQLLLGTFNDGRQAMVFGVNPLGVQMDGVLVESNQARSNDFMSKASSRDQADLSPDFVFESKGRLTAAGYEIEVRVPFKSLKYPNADAQTWGLNVVRVIQHSGHEDSWAPAKRASLSFLGQSGVIEGLTDLRRGLVVDFTPEVTQRTSGTPAAIGQDGWQYDAGKPQVGGTVRWGVTNNITLNATANPDFSQIESDAGQVVFDPRQSLFFTEKRPFFLEGSEQFATPHSLVYTRRIVQPVAAAKLTGKMSGVNVALLSAVDRKIGSATGADNPVYNIVRLQHDLGGQSRIGGTYTDRVEGARFNRVADIDGRYVFSNIYSLQGQYARSFTKSSELLPTVAAPLWNTVFSRNGKKVGIRYSLDGVSDRFRTQSGFIGRGGIVAAGFDHRFTWTAPQGRWLETFSFSPVFYSRWRYQQFIDHKDALEKLVHLNLSARARGGWNAGFGLLTETFGFDPGLYAGYRILRGPGDTIAFRGAGRIPNQDWVASVSTPEWQKLSANALYLWGHDENFAEWQSADITFADYGLTLRPSQQLRMDGSYVVQTFRRREGTMVGESRIPRLKLEYQLNRAIFVRTVGEYISSSQDALIDAGRTGLPLIIDGALSPAYVESRFRGDFLFSYAPMPGTVFFVGYGAGYVDARESPRPYSFPRSLGLTGYARRDDALFIKASYLLRL